MRRAVSENMSEPTDDLTDVMATPREEACMVVVINSRVMKAPLRSRHSYGSKVASVLPSSSVRGCHPNVNRSVESCSYSFTLCRVYIGNDD